MTYCCFKQVLLELLLLVQMAEKDCPWGWNGAHILHCRWSCERCRETGQRYKQKWIFNFFIRLHTVFALHFLHTVLQLQKDSRKIVFHCMDLLLCIHRSTWKQGKSDHALRIKLQNRCTWNEARRSPEIDSFSYPRELPKMLLYLFSECISQIPLPWPPHWLPHTYLFHDCLSSDSASANDC